MSGLYPQELNMRKKPNSGQLTPCRLKVLYPYQFGGPGVQRLRFVRGWMPVILEMCHEVDALVWGHLDHYASLWMSAKEKSVTRQLHWLLLALNGPPGEATASPETSNLKKDLLTINTCRICSAARPGGSMGTSTTFLTTC